MVLSAQDLLEIQMLSSQYAIAMDDGDAQTWIETWSENGVWQGGLGRYEGLARLRQLFIDLGERIKGKRHLMTNFVIVGAGDSATQKCYLVVVKIGQPASLVSTLVYNDKLEKIDGRWKFSHRQVSLDQ
jgi:SnoaL-like domain